MVKIFGKVDQGRIVAQSRIPVCLEIVPGTAFKENTAHEKRSNVLRYPPVESRHPGKQNRDFLLGQLRIGFPQGLTRIHGQRRTAPTLLRIKKRRGYLTGSIKNPAQVVLGTAFIDTSRF